MLMLDVRNAITGILDRYSLADVVEVTLRKMRRDEVPLPFSDSLIPGRAARRAAVRSSIVRPDLKPVEGLLSNLLSDYTI
jgi:hypothetical protein